MTVTMHQGHPLSAKVSYFISSKELSINKNRRRLHKRALCQDCLAEHMQSFFGSASPLSSTAPVPPSAAQPGTGRRGAPREWQKRLSDSQWGNATSKYLNCVVQWKGNKTILRWEKGHEKMLIAWAVISLAAQCATLGLCLPLLIWLTYPNPCDHGGAGGPL